MKCPQCGTSFYPQMQSQQIGENGKGFYGIIYWQNCPNCKEFIICLKQTRNRIEATNANASSSSSQLDERDIDKGMRSSTAATAMILFPNGR